MSFFAMGGASSGLSVLIVGTLAGAVSSASGVTHSMGNINVGSTHPTKKVHVLVSSEDGNVYVVSSLTVGGVSLAKNVAIHTGGGKEMNAEIWSADISSKNGSQAVSVTFTGTVDTCGVSAVATHFMRSLTATDTATDSDTADSSSVLSSLSAQAGGITMAVGGHDENTTTASWSSMTERADVQTGSGFDHRHTAAWDVGVRVSSNETITWGTSGALATAGASFR